LIITSTFSIHSFLYIDYLIYPNYFLMVSQKMQINNKNLAKNNPQFMNIKDCLMYINYLIGQIPLSQPSFPTSNAPS
jgi:hypothetical protein